MIGHVHDIFCYIYAKRLDGAAAIAATQGLEDKAFGGR